MVPSKCEDYFSLLFLIRTLNIYMLQVELKFRLIKFQPGLIFFNLGQIFQPIGYHKLSKKGFPFL